jgi:hypothetical protein
MVLLPAVIKLKSKIESYSYTNCQPGNLILYPGRGFDSLEVRYGGFLSDLSHTFYYQNLEG